MLKKLFKDTAVYAVASAITGAISFLLLPFLARKLSLQEYGVMDLLLSTFFLINIVVTLEISQSLARYYTTAPAEERYKYASTGLWFIFLMYGLFLLIALLNIKPLTRWLTNSVNATHQVEMAIFSMFAYGIFCYLQIQLRWMFKPYSYAIASVIFIGMSISLTYLFIHHFHMRMEGFFTARFLGAMVAGLLCWYFSKGAYKLFFDVKILKIMLIFSIPLVFSSIGVFFSVYMDRLVIKTTLSLSDLGLYSVCARIASVAGSAMTIVNFALTPVIYSTYKDPATTKQLAALFKYFVNIILCVALFLLLFSKKILIILAGERYSQAHYLLPLLVTSFMINGLYNCAPGLWIANKTKVIAIINLGAALLNLILCLTLLPMFGYMGAGIATLISSISMLALSTFYAQGYYYISYDWPKIISAIGLTSVLAYLIVIK